MNQRNPEAQSAAEWNSSLSGDYLWVNDFAAEMMPDVMTPSTWSLFELWNALPPSLEVPPGYDAPLFGNIGGRLYTNLTPLISPLVRSGMKQQNARLSYEGVWGQVPSGVKQSVIPLPRGFVIKRMLVGSRRRNKQLIRAQGDIADFTLEIPEWSLNMHRRIARTSEGARLVRLWKDDISLNFRQACYLVSATLSNDPFRLQRSLTNLLGEDATFRLLTGMGGDNGLASLRPVLDLAKIEDDIWTHKEYIAQHGHRSPYELELSVPRPAEDPAWLDAQLEAFTRCPMDIPQVLADQRSKADEVWAQFQEIYRRKSGLAKRSFRTISEVAQLREKARSEQARIAGVARAWVLRAGELTGLGEDSFFLTLDELCDVLSGDDAAAAPIPARKATYEHYRDLPRYPSVINGHFDPVAWAADPARRTDLFDAHASRPAPAPETLSGFAGATGVVEGIVRKLDRVEAADQLQPGEILVTAVTNVGWTMLFTRAAGIITDLGVPISHAALVARELGLPAVVGCSTATARLNTGDRVRIDGAQGTVTVL